mmetsp:Transcript_63484/g.196677  ORF Transcript_63484/g.196677 Transcript_63484/m.196677 type:complete len:290 (-) Transcript_63484:458-1327(-)
MGTPSLLVCCPWCVGSTHRAQHTVRITTTYGTHATHVAIHPQSYVSHGRGKTAKDLRKVLVRQSGQHRLPRIDPTVILKLAVEPDDLVKQCILVAWEPLQCRRRQRRGLGIGHLRSPGAQHPQHTNRVLGPEAGQVITSRWVRGGLMMASTCCHPHLPHVADLDPCERKHTLNSLPKASQQGVQAAAAAQAFRALRGALLLALVPRGRRYGRQGRVQGQRGVGCVLFEESEEGCRARRIGKELLHWIVGAGADLVIELLRDVCHGLLRVLCRDTAVLLYQDAPHAGTHS